MIRSSFVAKGFGLSLLVLGTFACGDNMPPATPETPPAMDGGVDMSAPSTDMAKDSGAPAVADTPPPPPPAPKLDLPAAAAKFKLKGKEIEIKSDGTVTTAGKPTHKVTGMELQDKDAKSLLKIDGDGNVMLADGGAYGKFDGDDFSALDGGKLMAGDDGISQMDAKGKKTVLAAKAEGIGSAKKATLLVVSYNLWGAKPPTPKAGAKPVDGKKVVPTPPKH